MNYFFQTLMVLLFINVHSQDKYYKVNISDGKGYLSTMNQSNDLMLNALRIIGEEINYNNLSHKEKLIYFAAGLTFTGFLGQAITHEEGHRSVLTELGIGSVSKSFFDKNLVAKVAGVTNASLINLRDNDFPNYIRLHTAGLESDYSYLKKTDAILNFNEEEKQILFPDYLMRKLGVEFYFLSYLFPSSDDIKELDETELKRDVVGHDLFGMIRHLHRPTMEFYRYTNSKDLTTDEKSYAKRMGYLSLLNFINPNLWMSEGYEISDNLKVNYSVNYSLAPFGDFVEQNAYLEISKRYKINPYFRQYFNKSNTFFAGGVNFHNYTFHDNKLLLNSSIDFWNQPKNLDFRSNENNFGFGLKSEIAMRFARWDQQNKSAYFNIGVSYKSAGFIPEAPSLKEDFRIHLGFVLNVKNNIK